ncbi:MAG: hypothetical protein ABI467_13075 [Kofleriaceae bacterium]
MRDAIDEDRITATVNGQAMTLDASGTGELESGDRYTATFDLPNTASATTSSTIAIGDGETTWTAELEYLFANDLAPTGPLVAGTNVFEWPSAASPAPWSTISWACVEVIGSSAVCQSDYPTDPGISIAQQYITATIAGASGAPIKIDAQRDVIAASSGNGPGFNAHVHGTYTGSLN